MMLIVWRRGRSYTLTEFDDVGQVRAQIRCLLSLVCTSAIYPTHMPPHPLLGPHI